MKRVALAVICIFIALPSFASENVLTIDEAVNIAVENSFAVKHAEQGKSRLEGVVKEVKSTIYPQVDLSAGYLKTRDESALDFNPTADIDSIDQYHVKATATQLIYSFGKVSGAIDAAKGERERSDEEISSARRQVTLAVHDAFYGYLYAIEARGLAAATLEQRKRHLEVAKKRYKAGVTNRLEVLRSEVDAANAEVPLISADNAVLEARAKLNNLLALDQNAPTVPMGTLEYVETAIPSLEDVIERSLDKRPEMKALLLARNVSEKALSIAKADNLPTIAAFGEYGFTADEASKLDGDREVWVAGVTFTMPIFNGGSSSGLVMQQEATLSDVEISLLELKDAIALEARTSRDALQEAEAIYKASAVVIEQANEALKLAETGFREGVATTLDVTDVELYLTLAKTNRASALRNHMSARAHLLSTMGEL